MNQQDVLIAGVGMIPFAKPGASETYPRMGAEAVRLALSDAGIDYAQVQQAYAGFVYGDSTAGQRVLYEVGMTGIPVINVNNNCATGSTALWLARQAVASGAADCVLALGFEQMVPGALGSIFQDRPNPLDHFTETANATLDRPDMPPALRFFAGAGQAYMQEHGVSLRLFAEVRAKASRHAAHNPLALFRQEVSAEDVLASPVVWPGVMTKLMACPPTCGAAAIIVCSPGFARKNRPGTRVRIRAQAMASDRPDTFRPGDLCALVGSNMAREAARQAYEMAGIGPQDIDVVELHDCFAQNEVITYEALGLCPVGGAEKFVADGNNTYGGTCVTNPSGGLLSKGHPLGATGLAQCTELTLQLRGDAGARQVKGARLALQHNVGLGGVCVVTILERTG